MKKIYINRFFTRSLSFIIFLISLNNCLKSQDFYTPLTILNNVHQNVLNNENLDSLMVVNCVESIKKVYFKRDTQFEESIEIKIEFLKNFENKYKLTPLIITLKCYLNSLKYDTTDRYSLLYKICLNREFYLLRDIISSYQDSSLFIIFDSLDEYTKGMFLVSTFLGFPPDRSIEFIDQLLLKHKAQVGLFQEILWLLYSSNKNEHYLYGNQLLLEFLDNAEIDDSTKLKTFIRQKRHIRTEDIEINSPFKYYNDILLKQKEDRLTALQQNTTFEDPPDIRLKDTTLMFEDGSYWLVAGDDGFRFDTFSTQDLLNKLAAIDYHGLLDTVKIEADINFSKPIVHLYKISQILGDRFISNSDTSIILGNIEITRLTNYCEEEIKSDGGSIKSNLCKNILIKLWTINKIKWLNWAEGQDEELNFFAFNYISKMLTEKDIIYLYNQAMTLLETGNIRKVMILIGLIGTIDTDKMPRPVQTIPRRSPQRTFDQSQVWCEKYIYPAFVKVGWLKEKK